ncbi:MAG: hypothetical protein CMB99_16300 [Flavobacteriaceae bacterium]|nr:hypothetical protein [Flavobacteriaceae bacterium]|tara:strand:- start:5486 stop:5917 length:432 start_codon:yes stop_codon:yes gene_type:complete
MAKYTYYPVTPNTKPRMTRRDKWADRPCVVKYREYSRDLQHLGLTLPVGCHHIVFVMPMPASWTEKERDKMRHQPHQQTPDRDNLDKALLDSVFVHAKGGDAHVWDGRITKIWGDRGAVLIGEIPPPPMDDIIYTLEQRGLSL